MEKAKAIIRCIIVIFASVVFAEYMNFTSPVMWGAICALFVLLLMRKLGINTERKYIVPSLVFSLFISFIIVLGKHMIINTTDLYSGTVNTSYVSQYKWYDIIIWLGMAYLFVMIIRIILNFRSTYPALCVRTDVEKKINWKNTLISMGLIFIAWLPYLIVYYPGFYFGDSIGSVAQAIGQGQLNNHHPVLYAMLIRLCVCIAGGKDSVTAGVAIYIVVQMLFMAFVLGYFLNWLMVRFNIRKWMIAILAIILATCPYFAQYSVAIWKDPIFSVSIVLSSILLYEMILKKNNKKAQVVLLIKLFVSFLIINFSRNNGLYIILATLIIAVLTLIKRDMRNVAVKIIVVCVAVIVFNSIVTGPIYNAIGVIQEDEKAESYGIFLAQMARVVALDGNLSEDDRQYMSELLPLEEYKSLYAPGCIDNIKYSADFDKTVLDNDFFKTYFSILKKNPLICFEAWEFQTFGFWSLNQKVINDNASNLLLGVPRNIYPDNNIGIENLKIKNVDLSSDAVKVFPYTGKCIPVAYANWLLIVVAFFAFFRGKFDDLIVVAPALGLMATLVIASPIFYWPRYGFAEQLLIPLFVVMLFRKRE